MSVISRRNFYQANPAQQPDGLPPAANAPQRRPDLAMALMRDGAVPPDAVLQALRQGAGEGNLVDVLMAHRLTSPDLLYATLSRLTGIGLADLAAQAPDPRLIDRLGADFCLAHGILPWRDTGGITVIASAHPDGLAAHYARLISAFGPVAQALAPAAQIEAALRHARGADLARQAETRLTRTESCRDVRPASRLTYIAIVAAAMLALSALSHTLTVLLLWASLTLAATAGVKFAALLLTLRRTPPPPANPAVIARKPMVSIMVALYKESDIATRLVKRLSRLDYPRDLLEILLVVEEEDHLTRRALAGSSLPPWFRTVIVPCGRVKTKPRALNYALGQCRGTIVGVYDAEDAPEADQIRKVVDRFHQRGSEVACLQGRLDFYNPHRNWLARCFTIEYASWFRVVLPGMQRLGLPIPLGGTTLFFRREVLERLGGWDSHNVTEDADLGMRLARHGYRTEVIETTTYEEANCRALPWVKQRSRWIKGYMMTYRAHMRDPRLLWRQLGPRGFFGFQVLFLGSLSQSLLAPLMWSMLALQFGLGHPVDDVLSHATITAIAVFFVTCEMLNIALGVVGLRRSGQRISAAWVPTLALYFPLQAAAAYKAGWEMLSKPFYWDKTSHGAFSGAHAAT